MNVLAAGAPVKDSARLAVDTANVEFDVDKLSLENVGNGIVLLDVVRFIGDVAGSDAVDKLDPSR